MLHIPDEQVVDYAFHRSPERDEPVLDARQFLSDFERIDHFRSEGKESLESLGEFGNILVRRTFEGVTEPALKNKMTDAHDGELYTPC